MSQLPQENVNFYKDDSREIKRRRRLAQTMMEQGKIDSGTQMVSGFAVPKSPLEGLAKAIQQGVGGYQEFKADEMEKSQSARRAELMAKAMGVYRDSPTEASQILMQDPSMAETGLNIGIDAINAERKASAAGSSPAPIEILREAERRVQAGDVRGANLLLQIAKVYDKGISPFTEQPIAPGSIPQFAPQPIQGYGEAVGSIDKIKKTMETQGQKDVEAVMNPQIKQGEARAAEVGKRQGEAVGSLQFLEANMPKLEQVVGKLSNLGKTATYTTGGRIYDAGRKELGLDPRQSAIDRADYVATVDNEILPLLRDTFGAQFTVKEGETLRNTLGDPNKSPQEKDAVLRAFIDQKRTQVESLYRQTGMQPTMPQAMPQPQMQAQPPAGGQDIRTLLQSRGVAPERIDAYMRAKGLQ